MTNPGIGAAGVIGIGFEQLAPPVQAAPATAASGGLILAGTYKIVVTAINASGETVASNEQTIVTTGATSTITVNWATVAGATGFNIYVTAAGGATGTETKQTTVGVVTTTTLTAAIIAGTALPASTTAATSGTYATPTKFFPFYNENLKYTQATQWRRPIRNTAGIVGAVAGDSQVGGDISLEALSDVVPYFLSCTRCTITKTGTGPFTYVFTPTSLAIPPKTMSITVVRNGIVFGYTGCIVAAWKLSVTNEVLMIDVTILGRAEAVQSVPVPTFPVSTPFGAGMYNMQIPTATQVFDTDSFDFNVDDGANPAFRLMNSGTGPAFVFLGESAATLNISRDFISRTDYDAFKALTAQSITLIATKGASESITLLMPTAIKDTFETDLTGEGDLVRSTIAYQSAIDGTGKWYLVTVVTPTESVPV